MESSGAGIKGQYTLWICHTHILSQMHSNGGQNESWLFGWVMALFFLLLSQPLTYFFMVLLIFKTCMSRRKRYVMMVLMHPFHERALHIFWLIQRSILKALHEFLSRMYLLVEERYINLIGQCGQEPLLEFHYMPSFELNKIRQRAIN